MKIYNKLVRDKMPDIIRKTGKKPVIKELSEKEYKSALDKKLVEEVKEYLKSKSVEELADIKEVIKAILITKKISTEELESVRRKKVKERGGFRKRIKLVKIED